MRSLRPELYSAVLNQPDAVSLFTGWTFCFVCIFQCATYTAGTLLVDCFTWTDPSTSLPLPEKPPIQRLGGGGLYALVGARVWLGPETLRILVEGGTVDADAGSEASSKDGEVKGDKERFPRELKAQLNDLGEDMWLWKEGRALKARIQYCGDERT